MSDAKRNRVLTAARNSFLRYGYRRVSMGDIAQAAGISRAALYLLFKSKEEIFGAAFLLWVEETVSVIQQKLESVSEPRKKLSLAFEIWSVQSFELAAGSLEARELIDCSFTFAQTSIEQGQKRFEDIIRPILALIIPERRGAADVGLERTAHVLASAARGFKQTAKTPGELRQLIEELLELSL